MSTPRRSSMKIRRSSKPAPTKRAPAVPVVKVSTNFSRFVMHLANDSDEMERYRANPDQAMKRAGLTAQERSQMRSHKAALAQMKAAGIKYFLVEMEVELISIVRPNMVMAVRQVRRKD